MKRFALIVTRVTATERKRRAMEYLRPLLRILTVDRQSTTEVCSSQGNDSPTRMSNTLLPMLLDTAMSPIPCLATEQGTITTQVLLIRFRLFAGPFAQVSTFVKYPLYSAFYYYRLMRIVGRKLPISHWILNYKRIGAAIATTL